MRRWPGGDSVQSFHRVEDEFAGCRSHGCLPADTRSSFLRVTVQQGIVAELENEQAIFAAKRELIDRFERKILATIARIWGEDEYQ